MESGFDVSGEGLQVFPVGTGTQLSVSTDADFNAGAHGTDGLRLTTQAVADTLRLGHYGDQIYNAATPWWDSDWVVRQCVTITSTSALPMTDAVITVPFDTASLIGRGELRADAGDLRAIDGTNQPVTMRSIGTVPATNTEIELVMDLASGASEEICIYGGNPTATADLDPTAGTVPMANQYFAVNRTYDVGRNLHVVAYENNTVIEVPGLLAPTTIHQGQPFVVANFTSAHVLNSTKPVIAAGGGNGTDTLAPGSIADTEFIVPTSRNIDQLSIRSPFGTATVEVYDAGALKQTLTIAPADGLVTVTQNTTSMLQARSTNGVPILVGGQGTNANDSVVAPPFRAGEAYYGVVSTRFYLGAGLGGANATWHSSNGTSGSLTLANNARGSLANGLSNGRGPAYRIVASAPFGALSQADSDGSESTMALPESLLDNIYYIPQDADYYAFACPTPGQQIDIYDPNGAFNQTLFCNGTVVGHAVTSNRASQFKAGSKVVSNAPLFMYYEEQYSTGEETMVFGRPASGSVSVSAPTITTGPVEGLYVGSGTWTSAPLAAAGELVGLTDAFASLSAGTTFVYQVAAGDAASVTSGPFVGPDGTSSTYFTGASEALPTSFDGAEAFAIQASITTSNPLITPSVKFISLESGLIELASSGNARSTLTPITIPGGVGSDIPLFRISQPDTNWAVSLSWHYVPDPTIFDTLEVGATLDVIAIANGSILIDSTGPFSTATDPIVGATVDMASGSTTVDVLIRAQHSGGAIIDHIVAIPLSA